MMDGALVTGDDLPSDLPSIEREIGGIEQLMRTDRRAYDRDEAKQSRLRDLYDRRNGVPTIISADEGEGMDLMAILPRAEVQQMAPGANYDLYVTMSRHAGDVVVALPAAERTEFIRTFEQLPQTVAGPMIMEIINKAMVPGGYCTEQEVRAAAKVPGGSIVREWGGEASQKLARVRARLWRIIDATPTVEDASTFVRWLEGLSDDAAKAVYRKLAA